jgi:hypothetical protein
MDLNNKIVYVLYEKERERRGSSAHFQDTIRNLLYRFTTAAPRAGFVAKRLESTLAA